MHVTTKFLIAVQVKQNYKVSASNKGKIHSLHFPIKMCKQLLTTNLEAASITLTLFHNFLLQTLSGQS